MLNAATEVLEFIRRYMRELDSRYESLSSTEDMVRVSGVDPEDVEDLVHELSARYAVARGRRLTIADVSMEALATAVAKGRWPADFVVEE